MMNINQEEINRTMITTTTAINSNRTIRIKDNSNFQD